jgi:hypothetical protein
MTNEFRTSVRAYGLPFRAVWLRRKDMIDLRFAGSRPEQDHWTTTDIVVHISDFRLTGVSIKDHKRLGLGRWLRTSGEEVEFRADEPLPSVSPGQAAVFYRDEQVLGGGWIDRSPAAGSTTAGALS